MNLLRKGYSDKNLLKNPAFDKYPHMRQTREQLAAAGITTYSQLINFIENEDADTELRSTACWAIVNIREAFNQQRIIPILIKLIASPIEQMQVSAARSLSFFESKRSASYLIEVACDKAQNNHVRNIVFRGLSPNENRNYFNRLRAIIFDETDDISARSEVLETINYPPEFDEISDYIHLLQHPLPDLRFWAAYRFSQEHRDIFEALPILDKAAATDHELPESWGWQVGREALRALEGVYWRTLGLPRHWNHPQMYLISPAAEYMTLVEQYREFQGWENPYINRPIPPVEMKIQPDWLAAQLRQQWPNIELNARDPKPQTYLLDWKLKIGGAWVIGGLHRDQYGVVLAGNQRAIYKFAAWYRGIIGAKQLLFFYEWADPGIELKVDMMAKDIQTAMSDMNKRYQMPL